MSEKEERISKQSMNLGEFNKERLLEMFPIFRTEGGGVDFDRLKLVLGESVDVGKEVFGMRWPGKADSISFANAPSHGTLSPDKRESVNFDTTQNLIIEGDNLEVLKLLQKSYQGKVKMIYIDPPYNTGNDFVYKDNFADSIKNYLVQTGQIDAEGNRLSTNSETEGRFHSNWMNMMLPRLYLANNLLTDDGVLIVSIDDNELSNLKQICDGLFGDQSYAGTLTWRKRTAKADVPFGISQDSEYLLIYAKTLYRAGRKVERSYRTSADFPGREWRLADLTKQTTIAERPNSNFTMIDPKTGNEYPVNPNRSWSITKETFQEYYDRGKIVFPGDYDFLNIKKPAMRIFRDEERNADGMGSVSTWLPAEVVGRTEDGTKELTRLMGGKPFPFPKPSTLISYLLEVFGTTDDVVLDFFAGSGTTAHAVMAQNAKDGGNRKFILVQLPEQVDPESEAGKAGFASIADITKERVRRAGKKIVEESDGKLKGEDAVDFGFRVLKLAESNIEDWDSGEASKSPENLLSALKTSRLKSGRSEQDVVFEVLVKFGVDLSSTVEETKVGKGSIWKIGGGDLIVIVSAGLTVADLHSIVKMSPKVVVMLDEAFSPESLKTNARAILKDAKIELKTF
jgi:adenine-specific DNA-methyltransferase